MIIIEAVPAVLQEESIHDCIDTVLAKIAEDRPWYNRIVLAADSNHINEIVKNRMKE